MNNQAEQLLKEKVNMADHILSVARDAVLKESGALPEDMPQIRGYDFNQGVDHRALLHSYLTTGFQASSFAMAVQEINKMIDRRLEPVEEQEHTCDSQQSQSGCTIFLGYTSNLISSGVRESIRYLAQHKMVDVMVTTAGGIEEDLIKCLAPTYLGEFSLPGKELRQRGINRIGNLLVPNDNYCKFEDWLMPILNQMVLEQKTEGTCWTPSKMIHRLGKEINNPDSVYYWAYKNDIPVFSPAITDGSLGDMIYFHSYKNPGLVLDIVEDIRRLNCKAVFAKSTGMIILGGGLVKHHIANANLMRNGADFAVYVNTGQEFDGSDSGARPDEAVSWGKIRMDAKPVKGAGGNWATVGRRSRGGRRVRRQREKRKGKSVGLRIGTLNVGTMTGKGRELADVMERRKVDILCVQETRWKGSKARSIGAGFKLFYYGVDSKRNGVGVVLKEDFVRNVLEVKRVSDRVMSLKLEIEGVMLNVVSGYAPQVGCELEEKERFWSELDEVMESIPTGERVVIGADFNGHVGEGNTGDEEVMGKFGVKERNLEGQMVVDFAKRMDMGVVNTYFQKREEHRVTYKSGGRRTQVDYILCRRGNLKEISDCKVVVGESVARQHRMVVCRMTLMVCKKKRSEIEKKTKWWKLKKEECCEEFRQKLRQALGGQVVLPDDWETTAEVIRETGRKVLGVSSGRRKEDKETWWWNEEVQDSIQRKRLAKKKWDMDRTEENRQEYKELQRRVKREVSKAKQKAYDELYTRLDTREGEKDLYRLARQRDRDGKDVQQVRVIKDRDERVLTSEESVQRRWKEYFEELMNEENEREKRVEGVNSVEQKVDKIRKDEVRKALKRMKSGKAVGPDDIPVEVWKCLGEAAVEFLASLFNRVLESERMPEEWRRSVLVPIFKNKGDVQSCSNYRGIKLMSHTMKVWERVVEARLRKVVEICEQQYGFMPRKSTTDAIFALRILMEKYRAGQRELHCVFVDLEKAYDRVPREELWYCMRKSGVAEKYVRVVQDMYERSRTVVRCAVGQTEEFNVEVGLHQGSALSPFLFAIVMDQLSEEVRQESPWTMMFADDIVICSESREQVEENLERWRFALERRGMKVSRSKTEYMCVNEREGSGTVRLQGEEVKKVQEFKYLGSTVQSNGECGKEVKKRVQAGWNGWRKVSGVLCDQKISARIKGKVYRTVVRPAMLYGLETVSLRKRQESELEVYADASIVFPLLVAETFAHQASKLTSHKKSD
ncbi:hypothetical protein QTP86_032776 [Hemibagrus guttatus]|nr:hypothetical protein QTP86_032776 [Hemibagrus guttatus]